MHRKQIEIKAHDIECAALVELHQHHKNSRAQRCYGLTQCNAPRDNQ